MDDLLGNRMVFIELLLLNVDVDTFFQKTLIDRRHLIKSAPHR